MLKMFSLLSELKITTSSILFKNSGEKVFFNAFSITALLFSASRMQNEEENNKAVIEKALKKTFSPEFLNRIDDVVIFNSLNKENIFSIIDILMKNVMKRLNNLGFSLELSSEAKDFIAEKGYDSQFGARPLHRAIQKYLEDPLAEEILNMHVKSGDVLIASLDKENGKITFQLKRTETEESASV